MKLISLSITNMRKIRAAEFNFDGKSMVEIRGRNGAGKSTVIDSIIYLLKGSREIPANAVTNGEEKGTIIATLGEYTVRRVIDQAGKSTLTVESSSGKVPRPQDFLDQLSGKFLDPEYFIGLPSAEKRAMILSYAGIDFSDIDKEIAEAEQNRLIIGRELKAIGTLPPEPEAVEVVAVADLLSELAAANKANLGADAAERDRDTAFANLKAALKAAIDEADDMTAIVFLVNMELKEIVSARRKAMMEIAVPERVDTAPIEEKIRNAESINAKARAYADWCAKKNTLDKKREEYAEADKAVADLREKKHAMVSGAKMPIKGLEITETGLAFNGVADQNWSDSEALKIALNVAIAYSGDLKAVYIRRGERLDNASLEKLRAYADSKDFQIIVEVVDDSYAKLGDGVVYISDGEVQE